MPREAPPRRKAAANAAKYKDVSSDDDMSDLMEAGETAPLKPGDDGYESEEDEDKIEKILLALEPGDIDAAELEELGSDDAKAFAKLVLEGKWAPPTPKKKKPVKPKPKKQKRGKAEPEEEEEEGAAAPPVLREVGGVLAQAPIVGDRGRRRGCQGQVQAQQLPAPVPRRSGFVSRVHPHLLIDRISTSERRMTTTNTTIPQPRNARRICVSREGGVPRQVAGRTTPTPRGKRQIGSVRRRREGDFSSSSQLRGDNERFTPPPRGAQSPGGNPRPEQAPGFEPAAPPGLPVTSFEWMISNPAGSPSSWATRWACKTAQCISVMEHVRPSSYAPRPFLVIAPLTTLGHWKREIEKWTT